MAAIESISLFKCRLVRARGAIGHEGNVNIAIIGREQEVVHATTALHREPTCEVRGDGAESLNWNDGEE
jgi:hypothetical protein